MGPILPTAIMLLVVLAARGYADNEPLVQNTTLQNIGDEIWAVIALEGPWGHSFLVRLDPLSDRTEVREFPGIITSFAYVDSKTWVGFHYGGLIRLDAAGRQDTAIVQPREPVNNFYYNYVNAIAQHRGNVYVATLKGVATIAAGTADWQPFDALNAVLPATDCFGLAIHDNTLWVTVQNHWWVYMCGDISGQEQGALVSYDLETGESHVYEGDGTRWFSEDSSVATSGNTGLPDNHFFAVAPDESGNIWCSIHGGIARYDGASWDLYSCPDSSVRQYIGDIAVAGNTVWIATLQELLRFDSNLEEWTVYRRDSGELPGLYVKSVLATDSEIWVTSVERPQWRQYENGKRIRRRGADGLYVHQTTIGGNYVIVKCADTLNWTADYEPRYTEYLTRFDGTEWRSWNLTRIVIDYLAGRR